MDETDFVRNLSKAQFNNKHEGYFSRVLRNLRGSSYFGENNVETEEHDENVSGVLNFMNIYMMYTYQIQPLEIDIQYKVSFLFSQNHLKTITLCPVCDRNM